ncbi:Gfo/Idh/MocA family oxidoreductase [Providencia stuartii]|uniref:Gfo/Idh/MocA family protein n=1 Tax=Providencia TaxID=586 RepID=UPI00234B8AF8|nr:MULTISPECIES: Gfo/Idh/MocA family oxidoreductase [unclassified Providencia]ELR5298869.1 Gfo/Idh/MocA family oxidoreductase [Providencia stuartii]MDV5225809.1 Gfo/Idh/MocA family oxidoreductase [Providencia rettgeri]MDW7587673.1 Gfo/Idh/MocA family oxidoreductase [Providencia sp. 2023EL-00965]
MGKLRIGIVGLGSIAQKAYLPVLSKTDSWQLIGAFSPNQIKAKVVCDNYRIPLYSDIKQLASQCDAVFVHTSTSSHFEVIHTLLSAGVHVYVDKPLAETLTQSEQLINFAKKQKLFLMVGFNRRFAPFYQSLKQNLGQVASLRMEKHRSNSVGPNDVRFTLLDDYLHVVDTAIWLAGHQATIQSGSIIATEKQQLFYAEHHLLVNGCWVTTSMHRRAGSQQEQVTATCDGGIYQVTNMNHWLSEDQSGIKQIQPSSWDSILVQRGFDGAIRHFIEAVSHQTEPEISGEQAIYAQQLIEKFLA